MVRININISNKATYTLIGIFLLFLIGGLVYAYGGNNPSVMGHSADEIEGLVAGGGLGFGEWKTTAKLASGATETITNNHVYLAESDGFISCKGTSSIVHIAGYTDSNNPPTTQRTVTSISPAAGELHSISMPVRKGDYWKIENCAENIYWIPLVPVSSGSMSCRIISSTLGDPEPVVLCCDDDEYAMGANDPELDSKAFFVADDTFMGKALKLNTGAPRCMGFEAIGGGSDNKLQVVCCK